LCLLFNAIEQKVIDEENYWTYRWGISRPYAFLRVIYAHAIKKDVGYAHATKSFLDTCMPCT
jgi:hypothetical protein